MNRTRQLLAGLAAFMTAALGLFALGTWGFGAWRSATFGPDYIPMAPITAILFVLLGLGQTLCWRWPEHRFIRGLVIGGSVVVLVVAGLELARNAMHSPLPWDTWFATADAALGSIPLGRMAPLTAWAFIATAVAVCALMIRGSWSVWIPVLASLPGLLIGVAVATAYLTGIPFNYSGQSVPMAWLTALTFMLSNGGLVLSGLLNAMGNSSLTRHGAMPPAGQEWHLRRLMIVGAGLLAMVIAALGLLHLRDEQAAARELVWRELETVADLKAAQIRQWREERLAEGSFLQRTAAITQDIITFLARPEEPGAEARVRGWLEPLKGGDRYELMAIYDGQVRLRLVIPHAAWPEASHPQLELYDRARISGGIIMSHPHRNPDDGRMHLSIVVPIYAPGMDGVPASTPGAFVLLRLDPRQYLYPLLQQWPVPNLTAEALLVQREGDEVVYLNNLRHQPDKALALRRSIHEAKLPAAMALRGELGMKEGLDYRGVPVLSTVRAIFGTSWFLVAKMDQAEAYAAARKEAWQTGFMVVLLLGTIALGTAYFWRQRQAGFLLHTLVAEQQRTALAERLAAVMRHANDIILLLDEDQRILEANERALTTYGYSLPELQRLPPGGLRAESFRDDFAAQMAKFPDPEGVRFETVHRRKDGSTFPVEVSGRGFMFEGRFQVLGIYQDLTSRKAHEAEITRLARLYAVLSAVNQTIIHAQTRGQLLHDVCRAVVECGDFKLVWIGWPDPATGIIAPEVAHGDRTGYLRAATFRTDDSPEGRGPCGRAIREERVQACQDFLADPQTRPWHEAARNAGIRASIALPVRQEGKSIGVLSVYAGETEIFGEKETTLLEEAAMDIAFGLENLEREGRRQQAEAALQKSSALLRFAGSLANFGAWNVNLSDGSMTWSDEVARIHDEPPGHSPVLAEGLNYYAPEWREKIAAVFGACARDGTPYDEEMEIITARGRRVWVRAIGEAVHDAAGAIVQVHGAFQDITTRKQAEATLAASEIRYRRLFESAKDGILILDFETGMVVDVNPFLTQLLGYSREEFLDKAVWELGFFRDLFANRDNFAELQRQEYIRYEDKPLQTAAGHKIEVEFVSNVYLVNGKKVIQCNIRDVSERIRAEKALRDSEAFNTSVLDSLAEHIAVLDAGGTILAVNRAWRDFATANGATAALAHSLGLNYLAVCGESPLHPHGEEGNAAHAGIRTVLAGAQPEFHLEYPCHSPTERRWFMLRATPLRGAQAGAVVSHENITARKEAEMALRISLQEKEALLKEVHHRVKNNLQVIMSLLRLEAGRNRDSTAHAVLKEMQGRILAMALLHETLYRTQNFARVDLAGYLREIATKLFRAQNLTPSAVRLVEDLVSAEVEIDQAIPCGLIVNELLVNALKHAFPAGRQGEVRLGLQPETEGRVRLQVSDDGVGLPADFSLESAPSLGLRLVSDLVKQLQGDLKIGPGAGFSIVFTPKPGSHPPFQPGAGKQ